MRRLAWMAPLVVVLVACSGSGESAPTLASGTTDLAGTTAATTPPPSSSSTTALTTVPSTSAPPQPTTSTTEVVPIPQTAGEDDFEVIWRELMDYHNWAFQNPEKADPRLYLAEECECFTNATAILEEYRTNGWYETSPGLTVHSVDVDISASTFALMTIVDEHSELIVVDGSGDVVRQEPRRPKTFYDVRIRLIDDEWRIVEWFQRGGVGDAE